MTQPSGARRNGLLESLGLAGVLGIVESLMASTVQTARPELTPPVAFLVLLTLLPVAASLLWYFGREGQVLDFAQPVKGIIERMSISLAGVLLVVHLAMGSALLLQGLSGMVQTWLMQQRLVSAATLQWMPYYLSFVLLFLVVSMVFLGLPGVGRAALLLVILSLLAAVFQLWLTDRPALAHFKLLPATFVLLFIPALAMMPFASFALCCVLRVGVTYWRVLP